MTITEANTSLEAAAADVDELAEILADLIDATATITHEDFTNG